MIFVLFMVNLEQPGGSLHPVMEQFKVPLFKGGNSNQMIISAELYYLECSVVAALTSRSKFFRRCRAGSDKHHITY